MDATAVVPSGRWKTTVDRIPVGIDGADGRRACNVVLVLLTADGIVPLRTPSFVKGMGLQRCAVVSLRGT